MKVSLPELIALLRTALGQGGKDLDADTRPAGGEPPTGVSARRLHADLGRGAGGEKYVGRWLRVRGEVAFTGRDTLGGAFVLLRGGTGLGGVQCHFSDERAPVALALPKGTQVTVVGRCEGAGFHVSLGSCEID